jgi:hypothetical protein
LLWCDEISIRAKRSSSTPLILAEDLLLLELLEALEEQSWIVFQLVAFMTSPALHKQRAHVCKMLSKSCAWGFINGFSLLVIAIVGGDDESDVTATAALSGVTCLNGTSLGLLQRFNDIAARL